MENLVQRSLEIILQNQAESGAYLACPNFPHYRFCWFRDGSFTAYATDLIGEHASAGRFHDWAAMTINRRASVVRRLVEQVKANKPIGGLDYLHTRYTVDGEDASPDGWPNFQLDGLGTWLWSLGEHLRLTRKDPPEPWLSAAALVADYLNALWQHPCYDCWEENPHELHPHTLAAIYSGLKSHSRFSGCVHRKTLQAIAAFVLKRSRTKGYFAKSADSDSVDASLLGLATPYRLVEPDDRWMAKTISHIEQTLIRGGGVHRYPTDSYYGGGEWVLLTGWLGWYYTEVGKYDQAKAMLEWMERQADANGLLPEQVPENLNNPHSYKPWVKRWGPIAKPLLWSHAQYIILSHNLPL